MRALGVDVGGERKGLDLVLMDERRVPFLTLPRADGGDLVRVIGDWEPDIIAIDSPPRWASTGRSRSTERELHRLNIHALPTPSEEHSSDRRFDWMRAGIEAFRLAADNGYPVYSGGQLKKRLSIEVFPHASAAIFAGCLPPKGSTKKRWRHAVLRSQGVIPDGLTSLDLVDAALSALTGLHALAGRASHLGDPLEGVIVLPSATLPAKRYAPGRPAEPTDPLFGYCGCGCGTIVRGSFVPGHDAKRKSELWRLMRDGAEAARELKERRWELPPETR